MHHVRQENLPFVVVRMSLSEPNTLTPVSPCSCSTGSQALDRVRIVTLMTRSSSSVKAVGCGRSTAKPSRAVPETFL